MTELGMSAEPLVSIIIDNYNYGQFIAQAIDSALAQTYPHLEVIVVDDGSTDNSRQVIESYGDRLNAIFQTNAGQGAAFNTGIAQARGEIICLLDSDDYFSPDKVAKVVAAFQAHPEWVQVSHGRTTVDRDGNIIGRDPTFLSQGDVRNLLLQWGRYAWAVTSGLSYRRSVLEQVLPIPKQPRAADTYLTATVPFYGQVGCIQEALMFYRKHGNNRRAATANLPYLIQQRQDTADCVNRAAAATGLSERLDIQRDADYRSFQAVHQGYSSWQDGLQVIGLTLQEALAIGQSPKDSLERLIRRGVCTLFPGEGAAMLRYGPSRYLRYKLTGAEPENLKLSDKGLKN